MAGVANKQRCAGQCAAVKPIPRAITLQNSQGAVAYLLVHATTTHEHVARELQLELNFRNNFVATLYKHYLISLKTRAFVCRLAVSVYNFVSVVFM